MKTIPVYSLPCRHGLCPKPTSKEWKRNPLWERFIAISSPKPTSKEWKPLYSPNSVKLILSRPKPTSKEWKLMRNARRGINWIRSPKPTSKEWKHTNTLPRKPHTPSPKPTSKEWKRRKPPTLTLGAKKREEKARKPAKNDGWLRNLQKTWYNRTASNFHNRLLLRYDMV